MHCTDEKQCHLVISNTSTMSLEYWTFIFTDLNSNTALNSLSFTFQEIQFNTGTLAVFEV